MLNEKIYVKKLFIIWGITLVLSVFYIFYFIKNYPLPITSHMSFDAKIKFIKENINLEDIDTLIVGSSIGLNNIKGTTLEKSSSCCKNVLNISVYESNTLQVQQTLQLSKLFPNLERIIYSAQFFDIRDGSKFKNYNPKLIQDYISNHQSIYEYSKFILNTSINLPFLIKRQFKWETENTSKQKFTNLNFDSSGSVSLEIYGKDIIKSRWGVPSGIPKNTDKAYHALSEMMKYYKKNNIHYYLIQQPYRKELVTQYSSLKKALDTFFKKGNALAKSTNQSFISLYKDLPLLDKYFADRSHLNKEGSIKTAKYIGRIIDATEKE